MEATDPDIRPIRVLLVEDEPFISEWVAESLTEAGFAVLAVSNAAEALQHLQAAPLDVLFTDINLPGDMDGMALAKRARELLPDLAVIYASGRVGALDSSRRMPGATFIAKPYIPGRIARLIGDAVGQASAHEPV